MSNDNTQDGAEPSLASAGSQPVAWGAVASDGSVVCMMRRRADVASYVVDGTPIVPLYRSPTLTDEERAFFVLHMERLVWWGHSCPVSRKELETVRGLFERLS